MIKDNIINEIINEIMEKHDNVFCKDYKDDFDEGYISALQEVLEILKNKKEKQNGFTY